MNDQSVGGRADLKPLTSLRFVAALMVFSYHCVATRQISGAFFLGPAGVGFFFLLSGFILMHTHALDFEALTWERARTFYVARIARVYPLHIIGIALGIVAFGVSAKAVLAQVLLVQAWTADPQVYRAVNPVSWSISIEAFFYVLFPLLAFWLVRVFATASETTVLLAALGLWCVEAVVLAPQTAVVDDWRLYVFPPARLVDFLAGMLLGLAFARRRTGVTRARRGLHPTSVELLAIAATAVAIYASPLLPASVRFSAALMPFFGAVIYVFARQQGLISRLFSTPVMIRLGEASFAFYLVHLTVIALLGRTTGWDSAPLELVLALGLALALNRWIEIPMRQRIRSAFSPRPAVAARAFRGGVIQPKRPVM